jgi:PST family polysaccharide transporter
MSLEAKVVKGTKWVAFANIFKQLLQVVSLVIFARLLSPDDFGLFALLMVFVSFLTMFTDMGTASALVHIKNPSHKLLSSVLFFNLLIGVLFCLSLTLLSPYISSFFNSPKLEPLLDLISINFIIMSLGVVQKVRYEKELDFKYLTLVESISIFIGVVSGIIFALFGFGVYSLVFQVLITSILSVTLLWIVSKWRPLIYFNVEDIKSIWKYTANLSGFNFINYFARNADNFLIGKFLTPYSLGLYSLAYNIMLYPIQNISRVLLRILFPAFSKIQDDNQKFKSAYLKTIFFISLISFPIMVGLMATSDVLVDVLFGDKWKNLSTILIILAPVGIMQSIGTTNGAIYMAKGNTSLLLKVGIWSTLVTVIFFIGGIFFGVEGVAISYLISNIILLYPVFKISWGQIDLTISEGLKELTPIFIISTIMGLIVWSLGVWLNSFDLNSLLKLLIMVLVGNIIYISLIYIKYGNRKKIFLDIKG